MNPIPDDPIVACMERTGYPPWVLPDTAEKGEEPERSIWAGILENLEAYGNPAGPCLYELPPEGGTIQ